MAPGTQPGDAYLTNLSSGYNIIDDFVYNPSFNWTLLAVSNGSYNGTDPDLGFNLVGSAVPEPSAWAMMLVGFAGLGFAGHRSSRKALAAVPVT